MYYNVYPNKYKQTILPNYKYMHITYKSLTFMKKIVNEIINLNKYDLLLYCKQHI